MTVTLSGGDVSGQRGPVAFMAKNGVAANLLMIVIIAAGLLSIGDIDQEVLPEYSLNRIQISVPYPGATPEEMEDAVVRKIEEGIRSIEGVRSFTSVAAEGLGSVVAELATGTDMNRALDNVKAAIDQIRTFPAAAERPEITEMTSRLSVMRVALHGNVPERTLKELASDVADRISSLPEVSQVRTTGVRDYEISIEVPSGRLAALGLTLSDVALAVRAGSVELSAGSIDTRHEEVRIRTAGRRFDAYDFEDIVVLARGDGTVVRLGEIAEVTDGFAEGGLVSRYNGERAAFIEVYRTGDERVLHISNAVEEYLAESVVPNLPRGVAVDVWRNEADALAAALSVMVRNGLLGLVLLMIGLALFLEIRFAFWVAAGIAISFVGTFAVMAIFDVSVNLFSLFAFILVMGIVVDDAVVVGESIATQRESGLGGVAAAIRGVERIRTPVVFGVLTTVATFTPLFFVPGSYGALMRAIPIVVVATLLISLAESLLVLPHHIACLPSPGRGGSRRRSRSSIHGRIRTRVARGVTWFTNDPLDRVLRLVTVRPWIAVASGGGALVICLAMVPAGIVGTAFDFYVEGDYVAATLEMPLGTPATRTAEAARELEEAGRRAIKRLSTGQPEGSEPLLTAVAVTLGGVLAGVGTDLGAPESGDRDHIAQVQLRLLEEDLRTIPAASIERAWLEEASREEEPWDLSISANLVQRDPPVHVELEHSDRLRLAAVSDTVMGLLQGWPGILNIQSDQERGFRELQVEMKPEGRTLGFTLDELARQVRAAFFGEEAQRVRRGADEIRVQVRLPMDERNTISDVETFRVRTPGGKTIALSQVAHFRFAASPVAIRRKDGTRVVTVTADGGSDALAPQAATGQLDETLREMSARDPGLSYSFGGDAEEDAQSLGALARGLSLALLAIYALLAIPFRSYTRPLIVMASIPFGLVGVILGHLLMGLDLGFASVFGVVGLSGVVVNDAIVMLDVIEQRRRAGSPVREAIIEGAKARFRPIFLTSLTTFLGLVPIVLEQSQQARSLTPMAVSLGFGILAATAVLMLIVPAFAALQMRRGKPSAA